MATQNDRSRNRVRQLLRGHLLAVVAVFATIVTTLSVWYVPGTKALGEGTHTIFGPAGAVGAGTARTYLGLQDGLPREIGVELTEDALQGLPAHGPTIPGQHMMVEHILELPGSAKLAPFKFVELDWNPHGHEPDGIYNRPHFDFHFYTITKAERDAIDPADPDYTRKAERLPQAGMIPAGYFLPRPILPFPRMGVHWVAKQASEFQGKPFTHTFIHGSWDGRMIFYEPMITKAFLETKPDVTMPVSTANQYEPGGHHPTVYSIRYDRNERVYRIALTGLRMQGDEILETGLR